VKYFNLSVSLASKDMQDFWNDNGFLVIEDFYTEKECNKLINRSSYLIENNDLTESKSVFDTISQAHNDDSYFLESGDKIRFFFEEKAMHDSSIIKNQQKYIINKIGHALHDLDDVFFEFSHRRELDILAKSIGIKKPLLLQSMYIFKQPKIGGEVVCHQDSTFLYTEPESAVGFWVALEDATIENGCLQVAKGHHKGPLRKIFTKENGKMIMKELNKEPFPLTDTILEVKKGTLVLLHGRLPHYSCKNTSSKSRHAYTMHIIDGDSYYPKTNWLQRDNLPLKGFVNE